MPTDAQNRLARKMETGKKQAADRDHVIIEPTASADDDCSAISSNREPAAVGSAPFSILDASRYSLASCATMVEHRRSVVHPNEHQHSLSWFSCTAIVVNYICVGYILLPYAFSQAGILLSGFGLGFVAWQSYVTGTYVLEACARAEALQNHVIQEMDDDYSFAIRHRTHELSELCRIFLGRHLRNFFTITTLLDLYGIGWAIATVFGSAIADKFTTAGPSDEYKVAIFIFMDIVIPLSLFPITDQLVLQMIFLAARMVMVVMMLATIAGAYFASEPHFGNYQGGAASVNLANFSAAIFMLQVCIFSTAFQFTVPGMASVSSNKKNMLSIFSSAVSFIYVTTLILSVVMASFFGDMVQESSNLNWLDYHGGTCDVSLGSDMCETDRAWWAKSISSYIVLFAALDGLAVFPLLVMSLGDILMGAVYEDMVHEKQKDWKIRCGFRLVASLPQIVGAVFFKDLGAIANYAGVFTLLSYTTCPAILHIVGQWEMQKQSLPIDTHYKTNFSSIWFAYGLVIFSCALIVGVIIDGAAATGA